MALSSSLPTLPPPSKPPLALNAKEEEEAPGKSGGAMVAGRCCVSIQRPRGRPHLNSLLCVLQRMERSFVSRCLRAPRRALFGGEDNDFYLFYRVFRHVKQN
ncbi:hypothetical protein CRE_12523 [Caenorhabditis remanei]|uniref:Uncharacterized protein n=1 Tax=Caenorhabditis remanei TaxID=31234 RepID=E3M7G0_CAERE|nr:hypothetical protein CRE_12523 [Caenorhabditis remanei]